MENKTLSTLSISFQSIPLNDLKTFTSSTHQNNSSSSSPSSSLNNNNKLFDDHRNKQSKKSSNRNSSSSSSSSFNNKSTTTNNVNNNNNSDDITDWSKTDIPPPLSGHASCVLDCLISSSNNIDDNESIIAFMGGISIGFKRINNVWLFSPKTYMIRKFDFIDPGAIVEFTNVANFIKSNNRKDELTYLHTYLNNLMNQILRQDSLSNESLEVSLKLFLKKKIGKLPNMENVNQSKKLNLEIIFKNYQTKMVEFLKKISNLIFEELNQLKKNIPNIVKSPTHCLKYLFPIPRERHGMCTIPESKFILIFGGIADKKIRLNDVWFLNLETMTWHEGKLKGYYKPSNSSHSSHSQSSQSSSSTIEQEDNEYYSLFKNSQYSTWIPTFTDSHNFMIKDGFTMNLGIKIPTARYYHSLTPISNNSILLYGGYDGSFRNDMWLLNILDYKNFIFEWKKIEYQNINNTSNNTSNNGNISNNNNIPLPRYNHWCGLVKDKILLFGGVLEKGIQTNDLWLFDIDSYRWKNLLPDRDPSEDYPERRSDHKCVVLGKFLILVGGVYKKLYLNNTFVLDLETLQWKKFNNTFNTTINGNMSDNNNEIMNDKRNSLPARIGFIIQPISNSGKALIFGGIVDKDKLVARANDMWLLETNLNENSISDLRKVSFLNETRVGNYVIERLLGRGGQACVFLVRDENASVTSSLLNNNSIHSNNNNNNGNISTSKYYALKRMDIIFNDNVGRNKSVASDSVFNEILILQQLKHVNILPTLSFFIEKRMMMINQEKQHDNNTNSGGDNNNEMVSLVLNIIMPYCESGDLSMFYVRKVNYWNKIGNWNELEIIEWLIQIALALEYIHERNIIHRDLKPSNIFVTFENSNNTNNNNTNYSNDMKPIMKLSDFGLAKNVQSSLARTACGTMLYLAPEIYNEDSYSEKVDIWSFGCIVAFMLYSGQLKIDFKIPTNKKKISDYLKPNEKVTNVQKLIGKDEYLQILFDCVEIEPEKRPSASQIVNKLNNLKERVENILNDKLETIKINAMNNNHDNNIDNNNVNNSSNVNNDQNVQIVNNSQVVESSNNSNINNNDENDVIAMMNQNNSNTSNSSNNSLEELKNEHEVFEIVNGSEDEILLSDGYSQQNISTSAAEVNKLSDEENDQKNQQQSRSSLSTFENSEENIWIEIQAILFKLEKEGFLTEEQVDSLSLFVINNHVGIKRFYLAVVKNCEGGGEELLEFKEEMARQCKRFLKIVK
ncbi:predicted protein [Naegleria gruberi]|uniref:non-specific serine/threonine protein kinase n=1 Tax=Naegleria gruberi TaxID=5762 RepID=D2W2E6_NAEGR|nr:uncharacterized protein NAEGRDRAFT_75561 [Naegleria gruberi]EFC36731.1 predicted protein [Naegleria gruberi]|eukprot:XP_002669475.1 predicted protein [Naegleria gruberi strain NEG-M]